MGALQGSATSRASDAVVELLLVGVFLSAAVDCKHLFQLSGFPAAFLLLEQALKEIDVPLLLRCNCSMLWESRGICSLLRICTSSQEVHDGSRPSEISQ